MRGEARSAITRATTEGNTMKNGLWLSSLILLLAPMTTAPTCSDPQDVPVGEDDGIPPGAWTDWGYCAGMTGISNCPSNSGFAREDTETCNSDCSCLLECRSASDCPVPETGTAVATCGRLGDGHGPDACILPCGDGEACPTGMSCQEGMSPEGPICVWHIDGEDNLYCNPDACSKYDNQADCEAAQADVPVTPRLRCAWATELIVPGGSDTCESVASEQKCVVAQYEPNNDFLCDHTAPCSTDPLGVYWYDLGGGDLSLLTLDGCDLVPWGDDGQYEICEFGDPTVPRKCDCACEGE